MRVLTRNKQTLWYKNAIGAEPVLDENGLRTGNIQNTYSEAIRAEMSMAISSGANNLGSQGMAEVEPYGLITGYTHRAVTEDMDCSMNEESLVWYGRNPETESYNFRVVRKAKSLNHLIYYLKEVDAE